MTIDCKINCLTMNDYFFDDFKNPKIRQDYRILLYNQSS